MEIVKEEYFKGMETRNGYGTSLFSGQSKQKASFCLKIEETNEKVSEIDSQFLYKKLTASAAAVNERLRKQEGLEQIRKELSKSETNTNAYFELADETGEITYHGVTFQCDKQTQSLCLGDVSNPENVLSIPLSGGGTLKVNRENLSGLSNALGLFTPEDVKRILAAVQTDAKVTSKKLECEEQESQTAANFVDSEE